MTINIHTQARDAAAGPPQPIAYHEWSWLRPLGNPPKPQPQPPADHDPTGQLAAARAERSKHWTVNDPNWRDYAECAGVPVDIFFPERGGDTATAKTICATCPVKDDCLADAMITGERFGIRGGTSERDRRRIRKQMAISDRPDHRIKPIAHGTEAGWMQEYRRNIPNCQACTDARNAQQKARTIPWRATRK